MKRALLLLLLLGVGVCMTTPLHAQDLINGALTAMGGADALAQVKSIVVKGTVRYYEMQQFRTAAWYTAVLASLHELPRCRA